MGSFKATLARGQHASQIAIAAGTAEAQSDTISLNIDINKMSKGDALLMIEDLKQAVHKGKFPPVASGTPTPTPSPTNATLPTTLDGVTGNTIGFPSAVMLQGPNADKYAIGAMLGNGAQIIRVYNWASGTLLDTHTVRQLDPKDDHDNPVVCAYPDGSLLAFATGHNVDVNLAISARDPSGVWTDRTPLAFANVLTYPNVFLDKFGVAWLIIRENNTTWSVRNLPSFNGTWSASKVFMTYNDQLYMQTVRYDSVTHRLHAFVRPNSVDAAFGLIRPLDLDCATGEFSDASGPLGKIAGASANGKTLPFAYTSVAVMATPPSGYQYSTEELSNDGKKVVVSLSNTSNPNDIALYLWTQTGATRFTEADYTKSTVITNQGGRIGSSGYGPGLCFAREPNNTNRLYIGIANTADAVAGTGTVPSSSIEQWDSADGITFTGQRLFTDVLTSCRPMGIEGAPAGSPVTYSKIRNFVDYNSYTSAAVAFFRPNNGRASIDSEAETTAWFAKSGTTPSALYRSQIDTLYRYLKETAYLGQLEGLWIMPAEQAAQRTTSFVKNYTLTPITAGAPAFVAKSNVSYTGGQGWRTGITPGAVGSNIQQNAHYGAVGVVASPTVTGWAYGNNSDYEFRSRSVSGGLTSARSASATTINGGAYNGFNAAGRGTFSMLRVNSTTVNIFSGTRGTSTAVTNTSAAFVGGEILLGGANDGTNLAVVAPDTGTNAFYAFGTLPANADVFEMSKALSLVSSLILGETA